MSELSPFRYPGGKNWFVPQLRAWLAMLPQRPSVFVEPFAGGASVSLAVAAESLAGEVVLMEKSREIAAVWHAVLGGDAPQLAEQALAFQPSEENIRRLLAQPAAGPAALAFQTLLRNRFSRSRELHPDAPLKLRRDKHSGEIFWRPQTLARRLLTIHAMRESIRLVEGDALERLADYLVQSDCAVFLDPPYSVGRLASHHRYYPQMAVDFSRLFELLGQARAAWLLICDDSNEIRALAARYGMTVTSAPHRNSNTVRELVMSNHSHSIVPGGLPVTS